MNTKSKFQFFCIFGLLIGIGIFIKNAILESNSNGSVDLRSSGMSRNPSSKALNPSMQDTESENRNANLKLPRYRKNSENPQSLSTLQTLRTKITKPSVEQMKILKSRIVDLKTQRKGSRSLEGTMYVPVVGVRAIPHDSDEHDDHESLAQSGPWTIVNHKSAVEKKIVSTHMNSEGRPVLLNLNSSRFKVLTGEIMVKIKDGKFSEAEDLERRFPVSTVMKLNEIHTIDLKVQDNSDIVEIADALLNDPIVESVNIVGREAYPKLY